MIDNAYSEYIERIGKPPAPMTEDWDHVIQTHTVLALKDNERAVGSIAFYNDEQTNSIKIQNVVVDPTVQARGYGSYMIKHVESEAIQRGLPSVSLYTSVQMVENIGYYTKLGLMETGGKMEEYESVLLHNA